LHIGVAQGLKPTLQKQPMPIPYHLPFRLQFRFFQVFVRLFTRSFSFKSRPSMLGILMRNYVKRPEWLYSPAVALDPVKRFTFLPRKEPSSDDLALCNRILCAYKKAVSEIPTMELAAGP
jgi:hypothetical protein